jgi:surface antigen
MRAKTSVGLAATATVLTLLLTAGGCTQDGRLRTGYVGTVMGGALGGWFGSQVGEGVGRVAATTGGALAGAYVGGEVGRAMEPADRTKVHDTLENTPTGETVSWRNPDTGVRYEVTPTRTFESQDAPCRDYTTQAWIEGQPEVVRGTACRRADGTWRPL